MMGKPNKVHADRKRHIRFNRDRSWPQQQNANVLFDHKMKQNRIVIGIVGRIIREGLSNNLFNNIIDIDNLKEM